MKHFVISLLLAALFFATSSSNLSGQAVEEGDFLASVGVGFGGWGLIGWGSTIGVFATGEYIVVDGIGDFGSLGVGGMLGYRRYQWDLDGDFNFNRYYFGGRAAFHFDLNTDELDLYAGLQPTVVIGTWSDEAGIFGEGDNISINFRRVFLGMNYFFTPNLAGHFELGGGLGTANLGLAFKF